MKNSNASLVTDLGHASLEIQDLQSWQKKTPPTTYIYFQPNS